MRRLTFAGLLIGASGALLLMAGLSFAQSHGHMAGGAGMHQHDEAIMPGLRGENATVEESAELAVLFRNFQSLSREVENLPNGIRTVTRSSDPDVMDALVNHAVGMIDRVHAKDDPKIFIQSPTLDLFFLQGDEIVTEISVEDEGLVVIQTSDNPEMVTALQVHAAEVTSMADRGMAAVHEMMMQQGRGH